MNNGFIVLYRSLLDWEWYGDINTTRLFLHCLLRANHKDKAWQGINIERGSFVTSYETLSNETGLSVRSIRTALNKLKTTGELTIKTSTKNTVIVINNYDDYQSNDKQNDKRATNKRQTNDKQTTTNNNDNKETMKQSNKEYGTYVRMTEPEYNKLVEKFGKTIADKYIEKVDMYVGSTGKKYKSHYMTVLSWITKDTDKDPKIKYAWQEELKAEQQINDAKVHEPKRSKEDIAKVWDKL